VGEIAAKPIGITLPLRGELCVKPNQNEMQMLPTKEQERILEYYHFFKVIITSTE
jgi:hypothetical protein